MTKTRNSTALDCDASRPALTRPFKTFTPQEAASALSLSRRSLVAPLDLAEGSFECPSVAEALAGLEAAAALSGGSGCT